MSNINISRLIKEAKSECNYFVNGQCYTLACFNRGGYPQVSNSPTCHAREVVSILQEHLAEPGRQEGENG